MPPPSAAQARIENRESVRPNAPLQRARHLRQGAVRPDPGPEARASAAVPRIPGIPRKREFVWPWLHPGFRPKSTCRGFSAECPPRNASFSPPLPNAVSRGSFAAPAWSGYANANKVVLRRAFLVGYKNARLGVIRCRDVVKRHVNVFTLRAPFLDKDGCNALGDASFHFCGPSFDPGDLHMRHVASSLERAILEILRANFGQSTQPRDRRSGLFFSRFGQSIAPRVLV